MQKIIPHLWFNTNAQEAVKFYTSIFQGGKTHATSYYPEVGQEIHHMPAGSLMTAEFEIEGYRMLALNGGPVFTFTPAISFMVNFDPSREEKAEEHLVELWEQLSQGGTALMELGVYPFSKKYGWIQDKYGVSWQLILTDPNGEERPKIIPSLMFAGDIAGKAEEAIEYYVSLFENSRKGQLAHYGAGQEPDKEGSLMFGDFTLEGQWFAAMDSAYAHAFTFNEAISLLVLCEDQEEIDHFWNALSAHPQSEQCGWLKDKYGVSWQISPKGMEELLNSEDKEKANKAMQAMLQMKKLDIAKLKEAFNS